MKNEDVDGDVKAVIEEPEELEARLVQRRLERSEERPSATYQQHLRQNFESRLAQLRQDEVLARMRAAHDAMAAFATRDALVLATRDPKTPNALKNDVLRACIDDHQENPGPASALSLLTWLLFPMLENLYWQLARRIAQQDRDDLFSRLMVAFVEAVERFPLETKHRGVARHLALQTFHRVYLAYQREGKPKRAEARLTREVVWVLEEADRCAAHFPVPFFEMLLTSTAQRPPSAEGERGAAEARLDRLLKGRVIAPEVRALFLEVYAYGRRFREVAGELGMSRENAKKSAMREKERIKRSNPDHHGEESEEDDGDDSE